VRVSTKANIQWGEGISASIASLPLNATTNVRVEAFGRTLLLFFNNTFDSMVTVSADRIFGAATLYISNPWYAPALASISSIQMKSISSLSVSTAGAFNGLLTKFAVIESTIVPANFALSFDIKPFGTVSGLASIIHYSQDNSNIGPKGRIPGMSFKNNNKLIGCSYLGLSGIYEITCASCYYNQY
jgi:hypothetical protein